MKKIIALIFCILCSASIVYGQQALYVSVPGNNTNAGTLAKPYKTISHALQQVQGSSSKKVTIFVRGGKYYLDTTLIITPALLQGHSLTIQSYNGEKAIISGTRKLTPTWRAYKNGILQAAIGKGLPIDELYCNGKILSMARYPNYDSSAPVFNGTAADAISPERVQNWYNPAGGYVHALHNGEWGSFHYRIIGAKHDGTLALGGGWQHNRPSPMHTEYRFVENIFEELDAPGEWYYDAEKGMLYFYPPSSLQLQSASFEYAALNELIVIKGTANNAATNVTIDGISFTGTNRTFMQTKEPLLRSDWAIYRGGAILLDGTENITIRNCVFTQLGGNAIFVSNYNRNNIIEGNEISNIGANAIAFVGNADAVRSPSFKYEEFVPYSSMDMQPGPKGAGYPANCKAYNNLIHDIGRIEKQVAGVEIDIASNITVSHNTIYNLPRAGINIGDGCWGGNIIEYNDVFNTVLETGDHGAFNSWGRDRYWLPSGAKVDSMVNLFPALPFLDAVEPNILCNNRFYCADGWDIDLDDGSSNYRIYNNLCLNGGLKLREGYNRIVENNIIVNNSFHPHVWFAKSNDVFRHNIVTADYAPIGIKVWGKQVDSNFFILQTSLAAAQQNGTDAHSGAGNPQFINLATNNYAVAEGSPAFKTGFTNFSMSQFGVVSPALKAKAAKAPVPGLNIVEQVHGTIVNLTWLGAEIKIISSMAERSAAGLYDDNGAIILKVPAKSLAAKSGLQERDVIRSINGKPVKNAIELIAATQVLTWQGSAKAIIIRNQQEREVTLVLQ